MLARDATLAWLFRSAYNLEPQYALGIRARGQRSRALVRVDESGAVVSSRATCGILTPVTTIIILVVLAAVLIGLGTTFGGPLLGVILAAAAIVGGLVWFFILAGSKTTTSEVVRDVPDQELFGPGGPDDPSR
jgi:hypothetical protein